MSQDSAGSLNETLDKSQRSDLKEEIAEVSEAIEDEKEHDMMVMMLKDKYDNIGQGMDLK